MSRKKKRRLTFVGRLVLCVIFLSICYFIYKKYLNVDVDKVTIRDSYIELNTKKEESDNDEQSNNTVNNDEEEKRNEQLVSNFITDSSESDSSLVKKYYANSISVEEFKEVLFQKENLMEETGKYVKYNYNFEKKLHYSEIEDIIKNLNNSDIVSVDIIGKSVDGRNIYGVEVGKGSKVLYLDANVHSAEIASTYMLIKYVSDLVNSYEDGDEQVINKLNNIKLAVVFSNNPDGYELYNFGIESINNKDLWIYKNKSSIDFDDIKFNANGVDLNRNFPSQNGGLYYSKYSLSSKVSTKVTTNVRKYYPGKLGSEPETKAIMYFMIKHLSNMVGYVDMHSQGRVIYSGKPNLPDNFNNLSTKFAKNIGSITNYTVHGLSSEDVGMGNDGTLTDFLSELACGFKFSSVTGRLSTNKYMNNSSKMVYSIPMITLETLNTYTNDVKVFKDEYNNHGIKKLLNNLLETL